MTVLSYSVTHTHTHTHTHTSKCLDNFQVPGKWEGGGATRTQFSPSYPLEQTVERRAQQTHGGRGLGTEQRQIPHRLRRHHHQALSVPDNTSKCMENSQDKTNTDPRCSVFDQGSEFQVQSHTQATIGQKCLDSPSPRLHPGIALNIRSHQKEPNRSCIPDSLRLCLLQRVGTLPDLARHITARPERAARPTDAGVLDDVDGVRVGRVPLLQHNQTASLTSAQTFH